MSANNSRSHDQLGTTDIIPTAAPLLEVVTGESSIRQLVAVTGRKRSRPDWEGALTIDVAENPRANIPRVVTGTSEVAGPKAELNWVDPQVGKENMGPGIKAKEDSSRTEELAASSEGERQGREGMASGVDEEREWLNHLLWALLGRHSYVSVERRAESINLENGEHRGIKNSKIDRPNLVFPKIY